MEERKVVDFNWFMRKLISRGVSSKVFGISLDSLVIEELDARFSRPEKIGARGWKVSMVHSNEILLKSGPDLERTWFIRPASGSREVTKIYRRGENTVIQVSGYLDGV